VRRAIVLLSSVLLVTACKDPPTPDADPSPTASRSSAGTPAAVTPSEAASPLPEYRFVPNVKGLLLGDARRKLERKGFRVKTRAIEHSSCVPDGLVLRQSEPPRSIRELGSRVTVDINEHIGQQCGLGLPPAEPALDAAGRAFVEFARGGAVDRHLLDTEVDLYLGGTLLHSIPPQRAVHRLSYGWLCPNYGSYSARVCPFSAVRAIATFPGPMAITGEPPGTPCGGGRFLHGRFDRTVTLTPDEARSCVDYFAVELAIDDTGVLEAVNLIWSEP
jgi:hypothetical protein